MNWIKKRKGKSDEVLIEYRSGNAKVVNLQSKGDEASESSAISASLPVVFVTQTLLDRTGEILASFAESRKSEGVVYWFGFEWGSNSIVTTLVVPNADTKWGCVSTTPEANAEALCVVIRTPLMLLGQAHSHPAHRVRHSPIDDRETFARFDGAISIVVPFFGQRGVKLRRCGVHRHIDGAFRVIQPSKIDDHVRVLPGEADLRQKLNKHLLREIVGLGKALPPT
jgi:hypothetical protein